MQTYPTTVRTYEDGTTKLFVIKEGLAYKVLCPMEGVTANDFFKHLVFSAPDSTATNKTTGEVFTNRWCTMRKYTETEHVFAS